MRRTIVGLVTGLALVVALAGCSSSDDEAADDPTTTTTADEGEGSGEGRRALAEAMAGELATSMGGDEMTAMLEAAGIDVELEDVTACFAEGMLDQPELLSTDFDALAPSDPAGVALFEIFFGCLPEGATLEFMVGAMAEGGAPPEAQACIRDELAPLSDDELIALFISMAEDDTAAFEAAVGACLPS